jgi:hypothetical protein
MGRRSDSTLLTSGGAREKLGAMSRTHLLGSKSTRTAFCAVAMEILV